MDGVAEAVEEEQRPCTYSNTFLLASHSTVNVYIWSRLHSSFQAFPPVDLDHIGILYFLLPALVQPPQGFIVLKVPCSPADLRLLHRAAHILCHAATAQGRDAFGRALAKDRNGLRQKIAKSNWLRKEVTRPF